jgi:hypothetical protein
MTVYTKLLQHLTPFVIHARSVMRKLLDDPGFTFWLFAKTTTTSGLYGSLANEEFLSLGSVLNVPDMSFTGKKDGGRLSGCLADAFDVEVEEKSKAFVVSFDTKDSSVKRWSPQFYLQWYKNGLTPTSENEVVVKMCQSKLRQISSLTRVAQPDDAVDVLQCVHVANEIISRLSDTKVAVLLRALAVLHDEDKPPLDKAPATVLQRRERTQEGTGKSRPEQRKTPCRSRCSLQAPRGE